MKFNIILKELRKNANLTQEQLSEKLNCSAGAVGLYEQGRRKPDDETLIALSNIFNVSIDYLLGLESTKKEPTIIPYGGNDRIDSIVKTLLNSSIDDNDLYIIEAVLDKYKK